MSHPPGNCPVCKKNFQEADDVVTCPSCGAPYHRDCYAQKGDCVFAAQHGPGFEYKPPVSKETAKENYARSVSAPEEAGQGIVCKNCQTVNDSRNIFCEKCGHPLHAPAGSFRPGQTPPPFSPQPPGQGGFPGAGFAPSPAVNMAGEIDGISMPDWSAYIGSSAPLYLARMSAQQQRESRLGFMPSAFFLGPFYFAYRKMWGWAALTFVLSLALLAPALVLALSQAGVPWAAAFPLATLEHVVNVASYLSLLFNVLCAVFALYLFRQNAGKKIKALREKYTDTTVYRTALPKKGGVNIWGPLVLVVLQLVFFGVLSAVSGLDYAALPNLLLGVSSLAGY